MKLNWSSPITTTGCVQRSPGGSLRLSRAPIVVAGAAGIRRAGGTANFTMHFKLPRRLFGLFDPRCTCCKEVNCCRLFVCFTGVDRQHRRAPRNERFERTGHGPCKPTSTLRMCRQILCKGCPGTMPTLTWNAASAEAFESRRYPPSKENLK